MQTFKVHVTQKTGPSGIITWKVERPTALEALQFVAVEHYGETAERLSICVEGENGQLIYHEPALKLQKNG